MVRLAYKGFLAYNGGKSWNWRSYIEVTEFTPDIESLAFEGCDRLEHIDFREGVRSIGYATFRECWNLTEIELPSTLKSIDSNAFEGCTNLRVIRFLGVETIGDSAFYECSSLRTIELPSTLKLIKEGAFHSCGALRSINIPEGVREIGANAFMHCHEDLQVKLPSSLEVFNQLGLPEHLEVSHVVIPEGIQIIGNLSDCAKMRTVKLPSTVTEIRDNAFSGCDQLESISVPEGVKTIGESAFSRCRKLKEVELPSSLKSISAFTFRDCKVLESITIPEGVERLDDNAFDTCESLKTLIIEANLIEIGKSFVNCPAISRVQFRKTHKAEKEPLEENTILHQMLVSGYSLPFIDGLLAACPDIVYEKNLLGQTPLHICITLELDIEITKAIYNAGKKAVNMTNEFKKSPLDYWRDYGSDRQLGKILEAKSHPKAHVSTALAFVQEDDQWKSYEKPNLLRGQHLILELPTEALNDEKLKGIFRSQLQTRRMLFGKLLEEFSELIEFKEKNVIQRAAAIQALANVKNPIDLGGFSSSGYWYQQEILKLVLRIYHEDQTFPEGPDGSPMSLDASKGKEDLEKDKLPDVNDYRKSTFSSLVNWIVEPLEEADYRESKSAVAEEDDTHEEKRYYVDGPALKPLQSLFNKLYIRRGQTRVKIVADQTRATLVFKDEKDLKKVISRMKREFPEIIDCIPGENGVLEFLDQISKMKKIPITASLKKRFEPRTIDTEIIPFRLKANSSQTEKNSPLLYNLNFFDLVPEYHWAGNTTMFVAFELQIGLESVIKANKSNHKAYDRLRILKAQPLLSAYIDREKDVNIASPVSSGSSEVDNDDNSKALSSAILEGNFSDCELKALRDIKLKGTGRNLLDLIILFWRYCDMGDAVWGNMIIWFLSLPFQNQPRANFVGIMSGFIERMYTRMKALGSINVMAVGKDKMFRPLDRLCVNFKTLNRLAKEGRAFVLDEVSLDTSIHYCIKAVQIELSTNCVFRKKFYWFGTSSDHESNGEAFPSVFCGIFASFGPYMVYFASRKLEEEGTISLLKHQLNFETLEKVSRLPLKCEKLYLVVWGSINDNQHWEDVRDSYMNMRVVLERYEEIKEPNWELRLLRLLMVIWLAALSANIIHARLELEW